MARHYETEKCSFWALTYAVRMYIYLFSALGFQVLFCLLITASSPLSHTLPSGIIFLYMYMMDYELFMLIYKYHVSTMIYSIIAVTEISR